MAAIFPTPFLAGFRTIAGEDLNSILDNPIVSSENAITAFAGGGQTNAYQLSATVSNVTVVASASDSVKLPRTVAGAWYVVVNSAASNTMKVHSFNTATINGTAGATGISVTAGSSVIFFCPTNLKWYAMNGTAGGAGAFTTLSASGATALNGAVEIGDSTADAVGFYGVTGITQRTSASQAAVGTTASTTTTPFGFTTSTQANAIVTLVNELRAAAVAIGLIAGA